MRSMLISNVNKALLYKLRNKRVYTKKYNSKINQENIDKIFAWSVLYELPFGINNWKNVYRSMEAFNNTELDRFSWIFDSNLSLFCIVNKSLRMLGFVLTNSKSFSNISTIIISLFNCYAWPHLKYSNLIWNPNYKIHITNVLNVQKKFLRYCWFRYLRRLSKRRRYPTQPLRLLILSE